MMDKKLEDKDSEGELFVIQVQKTGDEKDQAIEVCIPEAATSDGQFSSVHFISVHFHIFSFRQS